MSQLAIDLNSLLTDGRHFARKNELQATEIIDSITGKIIAVIRDPNLPPKLVKKTMPNGEEAWFDESLGDHVVAQVGKGLVAYHPWIVDIICEKLSGGSSLKRICEEAGMPSYAVFMQWRRKYPTVDESLNKARQDRAEYLRDKAMEEADIQDHGDKVAAAKLRHEINKWGAGVDDARYKDKAKVEVGVSAPIVFRISTGIDRNDKTPGIDRSEPVAQAREVGETHGTEQIQVSSVCSSDGSDGRDESGPRSNDTDAPGDASGG